MFKTKKLPKNVLALFVCTLVMSVSFLASAGGSGYIDSPASTAGAWKKASTYYACYSAANTAEGKNAYVYFRNYQSLQGNFESSNTRKMYIKLWEKDGLGSDDDYVKRYQGNFTGVDLTSIDFLLTNKSGAIESSGDNCAELYIEYIVDKLSKDPATPSIASGLFQYSVGMK